MTDPTLKELLAYHQPLDDHAFKQQVLSRIQAAAHKRRLIMWTCALIGLLLSGLYVWTALPLAAVQNLFTPINGLLLSSIGLFVIWLWTETLTDG